MEDEQIDLSSFLLQPEFPSDPLSEEENAPLPLDFEHESHSGPSPGLKTRRSSRKSPSPHEDSSHRSYKGGPVSPSLSARQLAYVPALLSLIRSLTEALQRQPQQLIELNRSRRQMLLDYLNRLSGSPPSPLGLNESAHANPLRCWIEGPLSNDRENALLTYYEELALFCLGQAILLKVWNDRGLRHWKKEDLGQLNFAIASALKKHHLKHATEESWNLTKRNLYSWYKIDPQVQLEIWQTFQSWDLSNEPSYFLPELFRASLQARGSLRRRPPVSWSGEESFDSRFFNALWEALPLYGIDPVTPPQGIFKRSRRVFTPTLGEGSLIRSFPHRGNEHTEWIGFESNPFRLVLAELSKLWWGPSSPPLWENGTGLEAHTREQLSLSWSDPKPSVVNRIAEMEDCELGFVFEDRMVRSGRSAEGQYFKLESDGYPYFRKIKSSGTSLGHLQTCVTLSKLRPGALLFWAREEPLQRKDGDAALNFLLDRAKLVCHWNLTELTQSHTLPSAGGGHLFPKHLYLFQRETEVTRRRSHRPLMVRMEGTIRSHVEVPMVLEDLFRAALGDLPSRGHVKIQRQESPTPQQEWIDHWPEQGSNEVIRKIDRMREGATPLGQIATVREIHAKRDGDWRLAPSLHGFRLLIQEEGESRRIITRPLPAPGASVNEGGVIILTQGEHWNAPLARYLETSDVFDWLEFHSERRAGKWTLKEQNLKYVPIPPLLLSAIREPISMNSDPEWERVLNETAFRPNEVRQVVSHNRDPQFQTLAFVRAAYALDQLERGQSRLFSLVGPNDRINWRGIMEILPTEERIPFSYHPEVRIMGQIPNSIPILRIDKVPSSLPTLRMVTEQGFNATVTVANHQLFDILFDQLSHSGHPTWSEIVNWVHLPKQLQIATSMAGDILRSHGEQTQVRIALQKLVRECQLL